ncbi:DUF192 domain-containing protein [Candidatus Phycosocius spiralis]|uniref:DUF192 domain-containing protein n=1 Tax=Candidatus Phycosocius spiralis TaxID=2815099 RepID=A0ABQ4PSC4_9PROT|nr:DUF192 domain-containing protein [Candidatus Phycosocius spiralis]GIU65909.1 hypothetical protein PsB1_0063 [Candidatus Phycosocius spiralis]
MSKFITITLLFCVTFLVTPMLSLAQPVMLNGPQTGLRVESLSIKTPKGVRGFKVEVADTARTREIGMMWRTQVPLGTGMLFDFKKPTPATFWMENTLVSLDLIFIRENGIIANIVANAAPLSRDLVPSDGPVLGVLEIGAGEAMRLGIKPGQKVSHRIFPP